jgi:mono/diheme cytochrome c family protein
MKLTFLLMLVISVFVSCSENHFKQDKFFAGNVYASKEQLNYGKSVYTEYCMACHGVKGDGKGSSWKGMTNPPRNFKKGIYKFGLVPSGELPTDADLVRIIRKGLHGTGMLPWDVTEEQALAVVQYIKTFAPEAWDGKDKKIGVPVTLGKDPFGMAHRSVGVEKGKAIYHIKAACQSCHRGYVNQEELNQLSLSLEGEEADEIDDEFYVMKPQDSDHDIQILPPDFTWHKIKSASTVEEIAYRLAAGIGGTTMPAWKETLTDDEIWAVSYYVKSLMNIKDTAERDILMSNLEQD